MKRFADLCEALESAADPAETIAVLRHYGSATPAGDLAWALFLLSGNRLPRALPAAELERWVTEASQLPAWLIQECLETVGDPGETFALLLPPSLPESKSEPASLPTTQDQLSLTGPPPLPSSTLSWSPDAIALSTLLTCHRPAVAAATPAVRKVLIWEAWHNFSPKERLLWHRLLEGTPPLRVEHAHLIQALAELGRLPPAVVEDRWARFFTPPQSGSKKLRQRTLASQLPASRTSPSTTPSPPWQPTAALTQSLLPPIADDPHLSLPYPFVLTTPLDRPLASLGAPTQWQCEWLLPGTRVQLVRRHFRATLWSTDQTIISCPAVIAAAESLPNGTVLEGVLTSSSTHNQTPSFLAQDLLEQSGRDLRQRPLAERRALLTLLLDHAFPSHPPPPSPALAAPPSQADLFFTAQPPSSQNPEPASPIRLASSLPFLTWNQVQVHHESARAADADGLLLKAVDSHYDDASTCLEWRIAPLLLIAVLIAAQPDPDSRSQRLAEYTLALRHGDRWNPVAKLRAGLAEEDLAAIDAFVRDHITARFGPVRAVEPLLVFELAYEGIQSAPRTRQGFALRSPRLLRWRRDLKPDDATTLESLRNHQLR